MKLSEAHQRLLLALAAGHALKSHRDVDGGKAYQLHPLNGPAETVPRATVAYLQDHGLIDSNKKFPVAAYWLTDRGRAVIAALGQH
jgi:hypothetical protein